MKRPKPRVVFAQSLMDRMLRCAWSAYPVEAVGLIGGKGRGKAVSVYRLRNVAPEGQFLAHPYDQYKALQAMKVQGEQVIASFHSHPEGGATLSHDDRRHVFAVAPTAIVIGLTARAKLAMVAAFARARNGKEISVNVVIE